MKALAVLCAVAGFVLFLILATFTWRYFSSVTTRIDVVYPEPGIHCALASTSDGTALSCYPTPVVK